MLHGMIFARARQRAIRRQIFTRVPMKTEKPAPSQPVKRCRATWIGTLRMQILKHDVPLRVGLGIASVSLARGTRIR